jgi:hypothetical protein
VDDAKEMAKKALQSALPINPKNKASRKDVKKAPPVVQGVSEQFGDGIRGDNAVVTVTLDNFNEVVLNEDKDVVLLLHAQDCEPCAHFAVYFKRMADRFREMGVPTLTIARMDVSHESPPKEMNLMVGPLPVLAMIPASDKNPPWTFYSGRCAAPGVLLSMLTLAWLSLCPTFWYRHQQGAADDEVGAPASVAAL